MFRKSLNRKTDLLQAVFVLASALLLGCGSAQNGDLDKETSQQQDELTEEKPPSCVLTEDGACPAGCTEKIGWPWNAADECWVSPVVIDCFPPDFVCASAIGCYVELSSERLLMTPCLSLQEDARFRECEDEERELMHQPYCEEE